MREPLSDTELEKIARTMRDAVYENESTEKNWAAIRHVWLKLLSAFLAALERQGLEITNHGASPPKPRF